MLRRISLRIVVLVVLKVLGWLSLTLSMLTRCLFVLTIGIMTLDWAESE